jgi:hypothetical protein
MLKEQLCIPVMSIIVKSAEKKERKSHVKNTRNLVKQTMKNKIQQQQQQAIKMSSTSNSLKDNNKVNHHADTATKRSPVIVVMIIIKSNE